jgi:GH25 family lysozyme M1 (1,4-beta-N-acetylmuramidase)
MTCATAIRRRAADAALMVAIASFVVALAAPAPADAAARFPRGVDVSNHQGEIQWGAVPERHRFAFLKASEGTSFIDAYYPRNRRLAKFHGKLVGAYHFAQPGGATVEEARIDGRAEARFFHAVASPRSGELRPVLDLEISNGLLPELLKPWAKAFVKVLERRVGAKPMIYTSPSFWQIAMDDTQWFAERGYKALWIAHWGVDRPSVPADNWSGRGWTFWQFTSCGAVKGIDGCVDRNRYRYERFGRVLIRK